MAEFGLIKSFGIDNGELDGKRPQECFVLGYELAQIDAELATGEPIDKPVHADNYERIQKSCKDAGREFSLMWASGDESESWMFLKVLSILLLLLTSSASAQSITVQRDGKNLYPPFALSIEPLQAGQETRACFELLKPVVLKTDTIIVAGAADFGSTHTFRALDCKYQSDSKNPAKWITHCTIDAISVDGMQTKPSSTPGITLGTYARFEGFSFGGACSNKDEDGGLIGFSAPEESYAEFVDCNIDASQGMDWGVYSWSNHIRALRIQGGTLRFCRLGVAMAASGAAAKQTVVLDGVKLIGDANGSTSYGESSGGDVDKGGVLTAVLNRSGSALLRDCDAEVIGLTKPYNGKWGCPRIAALATNQYYSGAGATSFTLERNKVNITPGISQAWYDVDVRKGKLSIVYDDAAIAAATKSGEKLVAEARGGSGPDGSVKVWVP